MLLQILNLKPHVLPHKPRPGLNDSSSNLCPSTAKTRKEDRKVEENFSSFGSHFLTFSPPGLVFYFLFFQMYVRESAAPYVSMAEMMKKFLSNTREMSLSRMSSSLSQVNLLLFPGWFFFIFLSCTCEFTIFHVRPMLLKQCRKGSSLNWHALRSLSLKHLSGYALLK